MDAAFRGFLFRRLGAVQNTWRCALRDRMCLGLREWGPVLLRDLATASKTVWTAHGNVKMRPRRQPRAFLVCIPRFEVRFHLLC